MKTIKALAICAVGFGAMAGASAQTKIYITGSTALRAETTRAIASYLSAPGAVSNTASTYNLLPQTAFNGVLPGYAYENTSGSGITGPNNSNASTFRGYVGGNSANAFVIIKCSWSGSAAGVQAVAYAPSNTPSTLPIKFLPDTANFNNNSNSGNSNPDPRSSNTASEYESAVADVCLSDTKQTSSPFLGSYNGKTYSALTEQGGSSVGVVAFAWVLSDVGNSTLTQAQKDRVATVTNVNFQQLQAQFTGFGVYPLNGYTGNSSNATDASVSVYATGRDPDSGTRLSAFAEIGLGATTLGVTQYDPATGSPYPAGSVNGVAVEEGQSGESSGGTIRSKMAADGLSNVYITYMGRSDANTLANAQNGGRILSYNGVAISDDAIRSGQYTFWSFARMYYRSATGTKLNAINGIGNAIRSSYAPILVSSMKCSRDEDGGPITPTP